jgi:hypothetical protein
MKPFQLILALLLMPICCTFSNGFTAPHRSYGATTMRTRASTRSTCTGRRNVNLSTLHQTKDDGADADADADMTTPKSSQKNKALFGKQMRRSFILSSALALATNLGLAAAAPPGFKRIPTQFIAAIADPRASSGTTANEWGVWTVDPGPRGVYLKDYEKDLLQKTKNNRAPAGWTFDPKDWWVEEHGLIMEAPSFPLEKGRYLVTGGRLVTTVLEIGDGGRWSLEKGELFDVTHLPCRSARYTPKGGVGSGSPLTAKQSDFPVKPGAEMPVVEGCDKVDYAVLFVIGKEA